MQVLHSGGGVRLVRGAVMAIRRPEPAAVKDDLSANEVPVNDALEKARLEKRCAADLLWQDIVFVNGAHEPSSDSYDLCVLYSHYAADAEDVPDEFICTLWEACQKFGYDEAAMGWVLYRRNIDVLIRIKTTPEMLSARDWLRERCGAYQPQ